MSTSVKAVCPLCFESKADKLLFASLISLDHDYFRCSVCGYTYVLDREPKLPHGQPAGK